MLWMALIFALISLIGDCTSFARVNPGKGAARICWAVEYTGREAKNSGTLVKKRIFSCLTAKGFDHELARRAQAAS
jgi:hypothetical protein